MAKKSYIKPDGSPQSDCFSDKGTSDETYYMSVYFSDEMESAGKTVGDLQKIWGDDYTALAFSAADLRDQGERVWRHPNGQFPGHGACKRADGTERTRSQKRSWSRSPKLRLNYPDGAAMPPARREGLAAEGGDDLVVDAAAGIHQQGVLRNPATYEYVERPGSAGSARS